MIAASFNWIFRGDCVRNGIVPVRHGRPGRHAGVADHRWTFRIEDEARRMVLLGMDAIDLTLERGRDRGFRAGDRVSRPWAYLG